MIQLNPSLDITLAVNKIHEINLLISMLGNLTKSERVNMNASSQSSVMSQLNTAVATIYNSMTAMAAADAVFWFHEHDQDETTVSGEFVEILVSEHFGDFSFGRLQKIVIPSGAQPGDNFSVQLPCFVVLPDVLKNIFVSHAQNELFDVPFERLGLAIELSVYWSFFDEVYVSLNRSTTHLGINGFTESYFRAKAQELVAELAPYLEWLRFFEHLASGPIELERRQRLIADANMILAYLYAGGNLNFSKLTSLCDVAGSLQPVRNLIQKDMPELAV